MKMIPTFLFCAALVSASSVRAAAPEGRFVVVVGAVTTELAGSSHAVASGATFQPGAVVRTMAGATAVIALADGSRIKLRESSRLQLVPLEPRSRVTEVMLFLGGVFAEVKKRAVGAEFRVRTPGAVAAVRGTQFFTAFGRTHGKARDLWVCVNEGLVQVGTTSSRKSLDVPAGKGVLIKGEKDLTNPKAYDWTKKLNWNMDAASGSVEDKTNLDAAYSDLLDQDYR